MDPWHSFADRNDLATGEFEALLLVDLDVDGDLDVVMSDADLDEVAWYENVDGQGEFGPRQ